VPQPNPSFAAPPITNSFPPPKQHEWGPARCPNGKQNLRKEAPMLNGRNLYVNPLPGGANAPPRFALATMRRPQTALDWGPLWVVVRPHALCVHVPVPGGPQQPSNVFWDAKRAQRRPRAQGSAPKQHSKNLPTNCSRSKPFWRGPGSRKNSLAEPVGPPIWPSPSVVLPRLARKQNQHKQIALTPIKPGEDTKTRAPLTGPKRVHAPPPRAPPNVQCLSLFVLTPQLGPATELRSSGPRPKRRTLGASS